jgi:hypothetical protein
MPEGFPILMVEATAAALVVAAVAVLVCGWPWRAPRPLRSALATLLGPAAGFYAGCAALGSVVRWSPREDQGRFLLVLFPAVLIVEILGVFVRRRRAIAWLLRSAVAAVAARVLLHGSVYLSPQSELDADGSLTSWQLALLAIGPIVVWALLAGLARRAPGRSVPVALAMTTAGAAMALMLSGYLTGGMLGLPLAAGLAGAVTGSLALPRDTDLRASIGPGVIGLFSLLVIGHFFGELTVTHALLLFGAPLLCWLPESVRTRRELPRLRALVRVALVAVPVALVVVQAGQKFSAASQPASGEGEATADDYANYGQ